MVYILILFSIILFCFCFPLGLAYNLSHAFLWPVSSVAWFPDIKTYSKIKVINGMSNEAFEYGFTNVCS